MASRIGKRKRLLASVVKSPQWHCSIQLKLGGDVWQQLFHQMGPDPVPNPHRGVGLITRSDVRVVK